MKDLDYDVNSIMNFGLRKYDIRKVEDSWVYTLQDTKKFLTIRFNFEQTDKGMVFRILHFRVNPQSHHIGRDFILDLLTQLKSYNFCGVELTAKNSKAYNFWSKVGFHNESSSLSMHFYLR